MQIIQNRKANAGIMFLLVIVGIIILINYAQPANIYLGKTETYCQFDQNKGILQCDLNKATASGDGADTARLNVYKLPYADYIKNNTPAIAVLKGKAGTNKRGFHVSTSSYDFCKLSTDGRTLDCKYKFPYERYDVAIGRETQITVYFTPGGYKELSELCTTYGEEKCDGQSYIVCENNKFTNKGLVSGKCGYVTPVITNNQNQQIQTTQPSSQEIQTQTAKEKAQTNNIFTKIINWFKGVFS